MSIKYGQSRQKSTRRNESVRRTLRYFVVKSQEGVRVLVSDVTVHVL